jgi:hypothetical protein
MSIRVSAPLKAPRKTGVRERAAETTRENIQLPDDTVNQ